MPKLSIVENAKPVSIEKLFSLDYADFAELNYTVGTVHSVKGETFEAMLLFLKTRGIGKNYTTLIKEKARSDDEEELRIVYVGITRPRQLLLIAVPDQKNKIAWEERLVK